MTWRLGPTRIGGERHRLRRGAAPSPRTRAAEPAARRKPGTPGSLPTARSPNFMILKAPGSFSLLSRHLFQEGSGSQGGTGRANSRERIDRILAALTKSVRPGMQGVLLLEFPEPQPGEPPATHTPKTGHKACPMAAQCTNPP